MTNSYKINKEVLHNLKGLKMLIALFQTMEIYFALLTQTIQHVWQLLNTQRLPKGQRRKTSMPAPVQK